MGNIKDIALSVRQDIYRLAKLEKGGQWPGHFLWKNDKFHAHRK